MSFREDHPTYKSYKTPPGYHFHDVPYSCWSELESVIAEAGGDDNSVLAAVVINVARVARAGNVDAGLAHQFIPDVVSVLRRMVDEGKFHLFMDSLALLCDEGKLSIDALNEFLEDNQIGYIAVKSGWSNGIVWEKVEDTDDDVDGEEPTGDNEVFSENNAPMSLNSDNAKIITSKEQLKEVKDKMGEKNTVRDEIFISHRSVDGAFADMILDFFSGCEIPKEKIFCSSLPGNDVEERISPEVKQHLKKAAIIILILSKDYYESAYCISEAGVAWYLDETTSVPIGLPEINHKDMVGFLDQGYKLRRLDNDDDISYLFDKTTEKLGVGTNKHSIINRETKKLEERYKQQIDRRDVTTHSLNKVKDGDNYDFGDEDDEKLDNPIVQIIVNAGGAVNGIGPIVSASGLTEATVKREIKKAMEDGSIEAVGSARHIIYRVSSGSKLSR